MVPRKCRVVGAPHHKTNSQPEELYSITSCARRTDDVPQDAFASLTVQVCIAAAFAAPLPPPLVLLLFAMLNGQPSARVAGLEFLQAQGDACW